MQREPNHERWSRKFVLCIRVIAGIRGSIVDKLLSKLIKVKNIFDIPSIEISLLRSITVCTSSLRCLKIPIPTWSRPVYDPCVIFAATREVADDYMFYNLMNTDAAIWFNITTHFLTHFQNCGSSTIA